MSKHIPAMSPDPQAAPSETGGDTPPPTGPLVLEASLTVADVGDFYEVLQRRLQGAESLLLDGRNVEMIDGAGLQLLAAGLKEATELGRPARWLHASPPLHRAAATVGLTDALQLPAASEP